MKIYKSEIKEILIEILFALIGVGISVASFMLYNLFSSSVLVTVLICFSDVLYAYFHFSRLDFETAYDKTWFIKAATIYWAVLFVIITVFYCLFLKNSFFVSLLLYPIFLMPSFMIVVLIFMLILFLLANS